MIMKKNQRKKIFFVSIGILLLLAIVLSYIFHYQWIKKEKAIAEQKIQEASVIKSSIKEKAINNAKKYGYSIEFTDEDTFSMEEAQVKYSFRIDVSGICFDRCTFAVEEENVTVKEGTVMLTIKDLGNGNVDVDYDDSRILLSEDGTEELMFSGADFISNSDFDKETLVIDPNKIDDRQKSLDAYTWVMKFVTVDNLKEQYNKALIICNQLNE